jgi:hypothetical protein
VLINAAMTPKCAGAEDCQVKWGRAVAWVSQHSPWRIQTQTDNLIQTYGPGDSASTSTAFVVNKIPVGSGEYQISMRCGCANFLGCDRDSSEWKADFNIYVSGQTYQ